MNDTPTVLKGPARIAAYVRTLPDAPGVYRMLDDKGNVLYVGKAKSLKKRVSSYAKSGGHNDRITRMIHPEVPCQHSFLGRTRFRFADLFGRYNVDAFIALPRFVHSTHFLRREHFLRIL